MDEFYWKALTGRTLYRIATTALQNPRLSEKDLEARVERVAETEPTDGLWIDERGRLYLRAIEQDAVKVRDGDRITTLVRDKRLRWPDTFSEGPDGTIYVTNSHIQDMSWFKPETGPRLERQLWRIERPGACSDAQDWANADHSLRPSGSFGSGGAVQMAASYSTRRGLDKG